MVWNGVLKLYFECHFTESNNCKPKATGLCHEVFLTRLKVNGLIVECFFFIRKGNCKRTAVGLSCEVGRRQRTFHILSGSVLSVWSKVENVLAGQPGANSKVQIVRCRKSDGSRIVGEYCILHLFK